MNKRARVIRRKTVRAISMVLLLVGVLFVEALTMNQVRLGLSRTPVRSQPTVDLGLLFQSR